MELLNLPSPRNRERSSTHGFSIGSAPALLGASRRWRKVNRRREKWIIEANLKILAQGKGEKSSYELSRLLSRVHIFMVLL